MGKTGVFERIGTSSNENEYQSFSAWEAGIQGRSEVVHVGVVGPCEKLIEELEEYQLCRFYEAAACEFFLLTEAGFVIASYQDGKWKLHTTFIRDEVGKKAENPLAYIPVARIFARQQFGVTALDDFEIYNDALASFGSKAEFFLRDYEEIDRRFIEALAQRPELLNKLHWRQFEQVLSEIFSSFGYETHLGPGTGDEGVDLRLVEHRDFGKLVILVQAKKYDPTRKIQLQPVQALYGAVQSEDASKGILVSTCTFAPVAKRFEQRHLSRIHLAGPVELQAWLDKYCRS